MKTRYGNPIVDVVLKEYKNGNVVVQTIDGVVTAPMEEFLKQNADGVLYDLNRLEEQSLAMEKDGDIRWINDFAVAKVIRALMEDR